jgi:hypothetical protein
MAIVLLSPGALFPLLHQGLALLPEQSYNISMRYPLSRTPVYSFLLALVRLGVSARGGKLRVSDYMDFVLHPYTKNIRLGNRSEVTRVLFHALETELTRKNLRQFISLEELEGMQGLLERALGGLEREDADIPWTALRDHLRRIHDHTIRQFLEITSFQDFADKCMAVLRYIAGASTAHLHPNFHPYARSLMETFLTLRSSLLAQSRFEDIRSYERLLTDYVGRTEVAFLGTPLGGIQVLGLLETRNLSFERVFVLEASDDILPGSSAETMLLPQKLRESLGLETYRTREAMTEYHFDLLRHGAREVHLFYTENGRKEKSRFLERLIWRMEQQKREVGSDGFVQKVRYRVRLTNPCPSPVPKDPSLQAYLDNLEFSASSLDCYLACGLRFYYRYVLRLKEREEVSDELGALHVGTLVHGILTTYFAEAAGKRLLPEHLTSERLRSVVERSFQESFAGDVSGSAYLIQMQVQRQLENFLEQYQRPLLKRVPIDIIGLEQSFSAVRQGIGFEGRIDRIERRGETIAILDYKTGSDATRVRINFRNLDPADRDSWEGAIGSLQLPLYMMLCAEGLGAPLDKIQPCYLFLGTTELSEKIEQGLGDESRTAAEAYHLIEPVILGLAREIRDIGVPFRPPADLKRSCPGCAYASLCGTQWTAVGEER